ncbi:MAG: deoxyguanosinetriphosphate triphosphohydrolase [Chloroflexota bacterium]
MLAPYAMHSARSLGREGAEPLSPVRTEYQRDRDRIVHANAFRRLRGKTQVFMAPAGDHYATRLSHVLEVSQVARVIARALRLNEDLVEAIALAHDLGHAPFGHAGQEALDHLLGGGYRHDEQSLRVVQFLEKNGRGLNLTREVIDGIRTHRKPRHDLTGVTVGPSTTLEAEVVKLADAVAYINHDVDDAVRAGVIVEAELPACPLAVLGETRSQRINAVVCDIVETSAGKPEVSMSQEVRAVMNELREHLFLHVYTSTTVKKEADRARHVVSELFRHFQAHPEAMPASFHDDPRSEGVERRVADYIAGMTDFYAIQVFQDLFVPKMWPI